MYFYIHRVVMAALVLGLSEIATPRPLAAGQTLEDKSGYTLWNPTPARLMRELSADRPDKTDSPYTVDAGHFQIEMDFANMTVDSPKEGGLRNLEIRTYEVAPMNLKVGVLNNLDLQLVLTPSVWEITRDRSTRETKRRVGFQGMTPRLKWNCVGNDGGPFALALLPFIHVPLNARVFGRDELEGGLGIPYGFEIPGWELGFQTTFSFDSQGERDAIRTTIANSVSLGHSVVRRLSAYVEFFSSVTTNNPSDDGWIGTFNTWLTYELDSNWRLDGGIYLGVTDAADDLHPWVGMTWRF